MMISRTPATLAAALSLALATFAVQANAADATPAYVTAAVNDAGRPDADKARDSIRKPADMVVFAGIKPGDKVADFIPGGGYFTRMFSKVVGGKGMVYAVMPEEMTKAMPKAADAVSTIAADPAYPNIKLLTKPASAFSVPEALDVVWTSQNYHDMHDKFMGPADIAAFNKSVFAALRPGGVFIVLDHAAEAGSGIRDTDTLHRIDPAVVKTEVTAAGFVFEGENNALRNAADDHKAKVFDPAIRGKTDQFIYKFRKPAR